MPRKTFLRWTEFPATTRLLTETLPRHVFIDGRIQNETEGMWIDWDEILNDAPISTTEEAVVHVARGLAMLECYGDSAGTMLRPVEDALTRMRAST